MNIFGEALNWLTNNANLSMATVANYIGCDDMAIEEKLQKGDDFGMDDLMLASAAANYTVTIHSAEDKVDHSFDITPESYFGDKLLDILDEIDKREKRSAKMLEYRELKARLEALAAELELDAAKEPMKIESVAGIDIPEGGNKHSVNMYDSWRRSDMLDRDREIARAYITGKKTTKELMGEYHMSASSIHRIVDENRQVIEALIDPSEIVNKKAKKEPTVTKVTVPEDVIRDAYRRYTTEGVSQTTIGKELGVNHSTICKWFKKIKSETVTE